MYALPPERAKDKKPRTQGRRAKTGQAGHHTLESKRGMWELFLTEKKGARPRLRSVLWDPLPQQGWTTSIIEHTLEIR